MYENELFFSYIHHIKCFYVSVSNELGIFPTYLKTAQLKSGTMLHV